MYEFTNKEIRAKFKETKLGKKYNYYLMLSLAATCIFLITFVVMQCLYGTKNLDKLSDKAWILISISSTLFFISVITTCYFDGKRDGAIEQFKITLKK